MMTGLTWMSAIFINYRRNDSGQFARRLYDGLCVFYGKDRVFIDVDSIQPGVRWEDELDAALQICSVFLIVIADKWLAELDARTKKPDDDYVRKEIAAALKRGILTVPILVHDTTLPNSNDVPDDIKDFLKIQAAEFPLRQHWQVSLKVLKSVIDGELSKLSAQEADEAEEETDDEEEQLELREQTIEEVAEKILELVNLDRGELNVGHFLLTLKAKEAYFVEQICADVVPNDKEKRTKLIEWGWELGRQQYWNKSLITNVLKRIASKIIDAERDVFGTAYEDM